MLTDIEHELIDRIAHCWVGFLKIIQGPEAEIDLAEVRRHLLALQQMVMSQAAGRCYPEKFALLGGLPAAPPVEPHAHHHDPASTEEPPSGPESSS